jgi:hypothetical protein
LFNVFLPLAYEAIPLGTSPWADSAGFAEFKAWEFEGDNFPQLPGFPEDGPCLSGTDGSSTLFFGLDPFENQPFPGLGSVPQFSGSATQQRYGGKTVVLQSYALLGLGAQFSAFKPGSPGDSSVVWWAHFSAGFESSLGFQLTCDVNAGADETAYITFSFIGTGEEANPYDFSLLTNQWIPPNGEWTSVYTGILANTDPNGQPGTLFWTPDTVEGTILIVATCQNLATDTPTPPLYPLPPAPSPGSAPVPLTPASANTISVVITLCSSLCLTRAFETAVTQRISETCLADGNVGCNVAITCVLAVDCEEPLSTTSISPGRRGLRQATLTFYKTTIIATTKVLATALYLANAVRSGQLSPWVNAFSSLQIFEYDGNAIQQQVPFAAPADAIPISSWPSVQASWTGTTAVYGTCRAGGCVASCTNALIRRVTNFARGAEITCSCKTCGGSDGLTQYYFITLACASAADQQIADRCAYNVMQDVVCWARVQPLAAADLDAIHDGAWSYRPASIGSPVPQGVRSDGPRGCPSSSSSSKGLLGLLGLLGIIPLALCCLLLLLCLIRRKKREGDVHFATYDPQSGPAPSFCPSVPL